jgi:hypothetical protein
MSRVTAVRAHLSRLVRNSNRRHLRDAYWRSLLVAPAGRVDLNRNLEATYGWLCAAQDANPDGGVAAIFWLENGRWSSSYPETTGYIIPTFFAYATARSDSDARSRAIRMADWEVDVQMEDGAVRSGFIDKQLGPAVFNTGQALFGWATAFAETGDARYAGAAHRAASWLVAGQEDDGAWRKKLSQLTSSSVQTYNTRTAWALALAGHTFGEPAWVEAARRNCEWALTQQNEVGWFAQAVFSDDEIPLLHTVAYVVEGLLGVWGITKVDRYYEAAKRAIDGLITSRERSGSFSGRYRADWSGAVPWRCLTGEAQMAVLLHRIARHESDARYRRLAREILEGLARIQVTENRFPASVGALAGAHPVWAPYHSFTFVNWAAKFYLDGLLLELYDVDDRSYVEV